jgi:hypothetical protein
VADAVSTSQKGGKTITIPTHSLYGVYVPNEPLPHIMIKADGTLEAVGDNQYALDAEYFEQAYLKGFMDCAKEKASRS